MEVTGPDERRRRIHSGGSIGGLGSAIQRELTGSLNIFLADPGARGNVYGTGVQRLASDYLMTLPQTRSVFAFIVAANLAEQRALMKAGFREAGLYRALGIRYRCQTIHAFSSFGVAMPRHPELLLFDLGGVLVEFSGFRNLSPLLRVPLSESEIRQQWIGCPVVRAFEVGHLTPQQFAERFVAAWNLAVTPVDFLQDFRAWTRGFLPGARELLTTLRGRYRLACLSNSNAVHWERNSRDLEIFSHFEAALSSHLLGRHKPDPMIYQRALAALHVAPHDVFFFDDVAANVEAARETGITAFQVAGITELRTCLGALGLLRDPGTQAS